MDRLYLEKIVRTVSFDQLPLKWHTLDLGRFSPNKTLYNFQQEALRNAVKALYLYFREKRADKQAFYQLYTRHGLDADLDYDLRRSSRKAVEYIREYPEEYPVDKNKVSFAHFINRMSFWMATGSGKTLIIVKLIELLGKLGQQKELPALDILFLAHRDDLLEQFKGRVEEFNCIHLDTPIKLYDLRDYENVKQERALPFFRHEITVFYYRSDLICDTQKEKLVDFRNYDNGGRWYILLDEAHKGDKEDSTRQVLYSILSRNGFLFNFSATFADPWDFATCVYNFNLARFVEEGYGKHIYISPVRIDVFRRQDDYPIQEKQKIVLKALLLLAYIKKERKKIRRIDGRLYHEPLLLVLVNSVDVVDSDLELFFRELEKLAKGEVRVELVDAAKAELVEEFQNQPQFCFEKKNCRLDLHQVSALSYKDILHYVYNAETPGTIEVLVSPGNRQELLFKLKTGDRPFALIKIGDITSWLKDKLTGYEISESFESESYFSSINSSSEINILMGSRSFYEGWDSNRPNIILFINIGVGSHARKFVLQAIGRGVRIEPRKHQRKRLEKLLGAGVIDEELFDQVKNFVLPLETLFVYGTNAENLQEIVTTLRREKADPDLEREGVPSSIGQLCAEAVAAGDTAQMSLVEKQEHERYAISSRDFQLASKYLDFLGDKVALAKYGCELNVLQAAKRSFQLKNMHKYYAFRKDLPPLLDPEVVLERILRHFAEKMPVDNEGKHSWVRVQRVGED